MTTSSTRFEIKASRSKAATLSAGAFLFVAFGTYFIRRPTVLDFAMGVVGIGFFSIIGVTTLYRALRPGVAVVVDDDGIFDNASLFAAAGRLSWAEIKSAYVYDFFGQTMLGIVPRDGDAFLKRQPSWKRFLFRRSVGLGCALVNIPESILPVSAQTVLSAMHERWPARPEQEAEESHRT